MNEIIEVIYRTLIVLLISFVLFKLMGKKQVSQMSIFDYIIGITIGSVIADICIDIDRNFTAGIICLLIFGIADIIISYLSLKSNKLRILFDGKATPLIENGQINRKNMNKHKITINILQSEARLMGYFNLDEINNAILEPSGMISFEPKEQEKTTTKKDIGIKNPNKGLVYNLIIDGEIIKENLNNVNKNLQWLNHELKVLGKKQEEILLLTIDDNDKINYYKK